MAALSSAPLSPRAASSISLDPALFIKSGESDFADLYVCMICFEILDEPSELPCGHTGCNNCLLRTLNVSQQCPKCKAPCAVDALRRVAFIARQIAALDMRCPNHVKGCQSIFTVGIGGRTYRAHVDDCLFQQIPCNDCKENVTCQHCRTSMKACEIKSHIESGLMGAPCAGLKPCPHGCTALPLLPFKDKNEDGKEQKYVPVSPASVSSSVASVEDGLVDQRSHSLPLYLGEYDMAIHVELVCPYRTVACSICESKMQAQAMKYHMTNPEMIAIHVAKLLAVVEADRVIMREQRDLLQKEEKARTELKTEIEELKKLHKEEVEKSAEAHANVKRRCEALNMEIEELHHQRRSFKIDMFVADSNEESEEVMVHGFVWKVKTVCTFDKVYLELLVRGPYGPIYASVKWIRRESKSDRAAVLADDKVRVRFLGPGSKTAIWCFNRTDLPQKSVVGCVITLDDDVDWGMNKRTRNS